MKASEANKIACEALKKPNEEYEALMVKIQNAAEKGEFKIISCNLKEKTIMALRNDGYCVTYSGVNYNETDYTISW